MTAVTATLPGFRTPPSTRQRLTLSLALSVVAHLMVIAMVAELLKPVLISVPGRAGQALPIEVALVGVKPIAFTAPPETPALAGEVPVAPQAVGSAPSPAPAPSPTPAVVPVTTQPFGVSVQSDVNAATISADAAPPPGDTWVRAISDTERLGHVQALRLAQRFPRTAARLPELNGPLIVPYPPRAARAHAQAHIGALILLDSNGRVADVTLFPDEPLFRPAILEALDGAHFTPAIIDAQPTPYWMILEFVFSMRPAAKPPAKE